MMLVRLIGSVGLHVITKGMVSVRHASCHCVPKGVRRGNVRGPLYLVLRKFLSKGR